jgi:hypothetical protein
MAHTGRASGDGAVIIGRAMLGCRRRGRDIPEPIPHLEDAARRSGQAADERGWTARGGVPRMDTAPK